MAMMILYTDKELVDLLVELANETEIPSESNLLADVREEILARLTKRAADVCQCPTYNGVRLDEEGNQLCLDCAGTHR